MSAKGKICKQCKKLISDDLEKESIDYGNGAAICGPCRLKAINPLDQ